MKNKLLAILSFFVFVGYSQNTPKSVAIVGGGISGVATAHQLLKIDSTIQITIFEKENVLGGNARSFKTKNKNGAPVTVDMGPQYFADAPKNKVGPWEEYIKLLNDYQLYDTSKLSTFLGTIVVNNNIDIKPDFVSPKDGKWRGQSLGGLLNFFKIFRRSKQIYWGDREDFESDIEGWVESLPIKDSFKIKVAYPFLAASLGTTVENIKKADTKEMSKIVAFGRSDFMVLDAGMGTMIQEMGSVLQERGVNIRLNAEVISVHQHDEKSAVVLANNEELEYDNVVLAVHADHAMKILSNSNTYKSLPHELGGFDYFKAHIVLHSDSSFVNNEKEAFLNIRTDKTTYKLTSSTMNLSQVDNRYTGLFKSWLSDADYEKVKSNGTFIHEETFWHPMLPANVQDKLLKLKNGFDQFNSLHIAGGWTEGLETQETAVKSAQRVANEIYYPKESLR